MNQLPVPHDHATCSCFELKTSYLQWKRWNESLYGSIEMWQPRSMSSEVALILTVLQSIQLWWPFVTVTPIHKYHYNGVIMGAMASQINSFTIVYSVVYSGAAQRKHQSSTSLAFVRGIHRWPVNSPHKVSVTRIMFPFDDVIMRWLFQTPPTHPILHHQTTTERQACERIFVEWIPKIVCRCI